MFKVLRKILLPVVILIALQGIVFAGENGMLENGIKIIEKPRSFTNTVTVAIFIKGGLFKETPAKNGLGSLASQVWVKSNKILDTTEFYGGSISAKLTPYAFEISFSAPSDVVDKMVSDFEDFLLKPKFAKDVFAREKALLIDELKASKDDPNSVAYERFNEEVFKGTPYAMPVDGKIETVEKLTLNDIENYYKSNLKGSQIIVAVAGKYDKKFIDRLTKNLLKIDKGEVLKFSCENNTIAKDSRMEDTDTRIKQAKMFVGYTAPAVSSPEYPAVKVLSELLGGGMSSRYFTEIRKNLGYAYSVGAAYPSRLCSSRFFASVGLDYDNVNHAVEKIDEINKNLATTMTDEEITKAKNSILGSALIETQTNAAVAWNAAFFEAMGLGADYYDKYVETLKKIGKKELLKAAEIFKGPKIVYILKPSSPDKPL